MYTHLHCCTYLGIYNNMDSSFPYIAWGTGTNLHFQASDRKNPFNVCCFTPVQHLYSTFGAEYSICL
jgi:hypothetical protein